MSVIPKIVEQSDVVPVALEFCKDMLRQESIEKIVRDSIGWIPNYANLLHDKELAVWSFSDSDSEFLYSIFRYTFVYYKKYKMLCVIGDYTDYKQIIFQNSCDQDENFDTWGALYADDPCRDIFKELVCRTVSCENIADIRKYFDDVDWESNLDIDYFRRWFVYKKIENALCIDDVLWDVDSEDFFKFEFGKRLTVSNTTNIKVAAVKALSKEIEKLKG
jgi:hypothetical protein